MAGWWVEDDGVHQVRLLRAPVWCPSGGGGTREARGTVVVAGSLVGRGSTLSGEYAPDLAMMKGSSIADEPGEC